MSFHILCLCIFLSIIRAHDTSCFDDGDPANFTTPSIASGYNFQFLTNQLKHPKSIIFDSAGNLLVAGDPAGIVALRLKQRTKDCVSIDEKVIVINAQELRLNHGIALSKDGRTLYASSEEAVYAWDYSPDTSTAGRMIRKTIVYGMTSSGHTTRTILISDKYPDSLLVSRGSTKDMDEEAMHLDFGKSMIKAFNLSLPVRQNYTTDGKLLGWGLRNSVGVGEDSQGGIWAVENSADAIVRERVDIHVDNPADELNYLGLLEDTIFSSEYLAPNFGYPYCFAAWEPQNIASPDYEMEVGSQFALVMNETLTDKTCRDNFQAPRLSFEAHSAPLDIKFHPTTRNAWVSFHGPTGFKLSVIEFEGGQPRERNTSRYAAKSVLWNANMTQCPSRCFRPVGIAFDSMNRTWVSSDSTGEILIITPLTEGDNSTHGGGDNSTPGVGDCCPGDIDLSIAANFWMGRSLKGVILAVLAVGVWLI